MAAQKIGYPNKQSGSLWTSSNANEVKDVVNSHADDIDEVGSRVNLANQTLLTLEQNVASLTDMAKIPVVQHNSTLVSIPPNKRNVWGRISSLTLTFLSGEAGVANEYMIQFTVLSENFSLVFTDSVKWLEEPEWEVGYTYQISILNGLAIVAGWEDAQDESLIVERVYIRTKANVAPIIADGGDPTGGIDSAGKSDSNSGYLPMAHVSNGEIERNSLDERSVGQIGLYDGDSSYGECTATAKGTNSTWPYEWVATRTKNGTEPWGIYSGVMVINS